MPDFLRQDEMKELIRSESDPITRNLMTLANHILILRVVRQKPPPLGDFDLKYYMEIIQDLAHEQETLKKILDGKGDELIWMADD